MFAVVCLFFFWLQMHDHCFSTFHGFKNKNKHYVTNKMTEIRLLPLNICEGERVYFSLDLVSSAHFYRSDDFLRCADDSPGLIHFYA